MVRIKVVNGTLEVSAGTLLHLSAKQAKPRSHKLEKIPGERGAFKATKPLQFKTGESLGVAEVERRFAHQVEEIDGPAES